MSWAILIVVGSVLLVVAGFQWFRQTHGQVQVGALVTTTTLPPELQGSSTIATTATTATGAVVTVPMIPSSFSPSTASLSTTRRRSSALQPAPSVSPVAVGARRVTVTVTAIASRPAHASCVPARIQIPFGSSNHPQGVSVNLIPHPLNPDSSLWAPGPDTNVAGWTDKAGWAKDDVRPGFGAGTVITIGHINYNGEEGAYSDLAEYLNSDVGKVFTVTCESGQSLTYRISGGLLADKGELAADWRLPGQPMHHKLFDQQAVYGSPGAPYERFLLMSCGGLLDQAAHSYQSNVFVYGVRVH